MRRAWMPWAACVALALVAVGGLSRLEQRRPEGPDGDATTEAAEPAGDGGQGQEDGEAESTDWAGPGSLPWEFVSRMPTWGETTPYCLSGLGPVLAVRKTLADQQWRSAQTAKRGGEVLARYEVWNAYCVDMKAAGALQDPKGMPFKPDKGFIIRAAVYWARVADDSVAPPTGAVIEARQHPKGQGSEAGVDGPHITAVRLEVLDYQVVPQAVSDIKRQGSAQYVIQNRWRIEGEPRTIESSLIPVHHTNHVLAVWDVPTRPGVRVGPEEDHR